MIQYSQQKSKCGRQTGAVSVIFTRCANRQVTLSVQGVDRKRDEYKGCGGTFIWKRQMRSMARIFRF